MNTNRPAFLANIPPATLNIIIINVLAWIACQIIPDKTGYNIIQHWGLHFFTAEAFNPLQFITYMFLHSSAGIGHLFFNMFGIYMFGVVLEQVWGWKKYLFFYLISGLGAAIIQQLFWAIDYIPLSEAFNAAIANDNPMLIQPYEGVLRRFYKFGPLQFLSVTNLIEIKQTIMNAPVTIGASGALFGILFAFGWMFPHVKLFLLFIPIPIPARIFCIIYAVVELFLGVSNFTGDNVAHFAHLGGAAFALILVMIWRKKGKLFQNKF